jgi:hypothetical protein
MTSKINPLLEAERPFCYFAEWAKGSLCLQKGKGANAPYLII